MKVKQKTGILIQTAVFFILPGDLENIVTKIRWLIEGYNCIHSFPWGTISKLIMWEETLTDPESSYNNTEQELAVFKEWIFFVGPWGIT